MAVPSGQYQTNQSENILGTWGLVQHHHTGTDPYPPQNMLLNQNFQRGGRFKFKNHPWKGCGYFLEQLICTNNTWIIWFTGSARGANLILEIQGTEHIYLFIFSYILIHFAAFWKFELIKIYFKRTLDRIKRCITTNKKELVIPDNTGDTTQEAAIKKQ